LETLKDSSKGKTLEVEDLLLKEALNLEDKNYKKTNKKRKLKRKLKKK
jgi:hypothetical protein